MTESAATWWKRPLAPGAAGAWARGYAPRGLRRLWLPVIMAAAGCRSPDTAGLLDYRDPPPAKVVHRLPAPAPMRRPPARREPEAAPEPTESARAPVTSPERAPADFRTVLALQVLLDRRNFSAGCADGSFGPHTAAALRAWQMREGQEPAGEFDVSVVCRLGDVEEAFGIHTVTEAERAALTPVPDSWRGKAQASRLGYETILEAVAEKCHASEGAIRQLNPDVQWPNPPAGARLVVPDPRPSRQTRAARIRIDLADRYIQAFDPDGRILAHFPCSIARIPDKRPVGTFPVVNCARNPTYTYDPALFPEYAESRQIRGKLLIPAGPNNPVGTAWIGIDLPGYGIHGTPHPEDIGKTESHGCFRLANWNAEKLLRMITIGTPVTIEP